MEDIPLCLMSHKIHKLFIFAVKHNSMFSLPFLITIAIGQAKYVVVFDGKYKQFVCVNNFVFQHNFPSGHKRFSLQLNSLFV